VVLPIGERKRGGSNPSLPRHSIVADRRDSEASLRRQASKCGASGDVGVAINDGDGPRWKAIGAKLAIVAGQHISSRIRETNASFGGGVAMTRR
jgi:hypothetical protein